MQTLLLEHKMKEHKNRLARKKMYYCSMKNRLLTQRDTYVAEESGFICNISESGLCISTFNQLKLDDIISLYFRLPAIEYNFFVKAKVKWIKDERAGCEFLHLNDEEKSFIRNHIGNRDNVSLYNYYQKLCDYFTYDIAKDNEKKEIYKLRYLIYVKEYGWEPENLEGLEKDEYDKVSEHFLVKDKNGVAVATTRLIFADKAVTPIEKYFGIDITNNGKYKREEVVEISRLCIAREYRRRVEDLQYEGNNQALPDKSRNNKEKQRTPTLLFALWKMMFQYSLEKGKRYWYMEMEPRLANSLINAGINLEKAGEAKEYHGKRTPYFVNLIPAYKELKLHNPALLKWFEAEFGRS